MAVAYATSLACLTGAPRASAQVASLGVPFVRNFSKADYGGGTQTWAFAQDGRGVIYAANNDGLLSFDGERWTLYPLPNRTIARSVATSPLRTGVYVGGQGIIGVLRPHPRRAAHEFVDLTPGLPPEHRAFEDVWGAAIDASGAVFFQTTDAVFRIAQTLGGDTVEVHGLGVPNTHLSVAGGRAYLHQFGRGLSTWTERGFALLPGGEGLSDCSVVSVESLPRGSFGGDADDVSRRPAPAFAKTADADPDALLVATLDCGLFVYDARVGELSPFPLRQQDSLLRRRVQTAALLSDGTLALGTARDGLLLVDLARRHLSQRIDRSAGLQRNNVRSCFTDAAGDLWLGLDYGIDHVDVRSPYRLLSPDGALEGATYAIQRVGGAGGQAPDRLYVGTGNGLYVADLGAYRDPLSPSQAFRLVPGSEGQVWGLDTVGRRLWLGHHEGAFTVERDGLQRVSEELGFWRYLPRDGGDVVAGTYEGLRTLTPEATGGWRVDTVAGFRESARILAPGAGGEVWVAQPYKGVYRVRTERGGAVAYGAREGLPADGGNHVFAVRNEVVVGGERGVFRYDATADRFVVHEGYAAALGEGTRVVRLIQPAGSEDIYYVTDSDVGVLDVEDAGLGQAVARRSFGAIRPLMLGGFETVAPQPDGHVLVGAERGLVSVSPADVGADDSLRVFVTTVTPLRGGDSVLRLGRLGGTPISDFRFGPRSDALRIAYAAPAYGALDEMEYRTRLLGLEEDFTPWTPEAERDFTNLPHGDLTFEVEARRRGGGGAVAQARFAFEVEPPWYAGVLAKAVYALLVLVGLGLLYYLPRRRYDRQQASLRGRAEAQARSLEEEVAQRERAIEELRTEKLELELSARHRELADATMNLVQKNELLQRLREQLEALRTQTDDRVVRKGLRQTLQLIADDERGEDDWLQFVAHFDQVHQGFFSRLRERYPQLTTKDHKLCAYLRMNLSTKEIAPLLNISVRGVEIGRYRLRKKLELTKGEDLGQWVQGF